MGSPRLPELTVAKIREDIQLGFTSPEIARRNNCSTGAVDNYRHPDRWKQYSAKRRAGAIVQAREHIGPNLLPWMTVDMLTGRRAPVARVRG